MNDKKDLLKNRENKLFLFSNLQETFKLIPKDNILIETDSPYLAPVPNRGKKNEPAFIDFTAAKLAELKNISKQELIEITTNNFNRLFFN